MNLRTVAPRFCLLTLAAVVLMANGADAARFVRPYDVQGGVGTHTSFELCDSYAAMFGESMSIHIAGLHMIEGDGAQVELTRSDTSAFKAKLGTLIKERCPTFRIAWPVRSPDADVVISGVWEVTRVVRGKRSQIRRTAVRWTIRTRDGVVESPGSSRIGSKSATTFHNSELESLMFGILARDPGLTPPERQDAALRQGCEAFIGPDAKTLRIAVMSVEGWRKWYPAAPLVDAQHAMRVAIVEACGTAAQVFAVNDQSGANVNVTSLTFPDPPNPKNGQRTNRTPERFASERVIIEASGPNGAKLVYRENISTRDGTTVPLEFAFVAHLMRDIGSGELKVDP